MKKLLIAFSMIGASALIACATDNGTPTTETIDWFKVTTAETTGGAIDVAEGATWEPVGNKFEVESDLEHLVSFEPTDSLTQKMAQVSFTLDAAIMPDELPGLDGKAKLAFAICQGSEGLAAFKAWIGTSGWITLTGATVPTEGTSFVLLVEFDNREATKKVRFSVGPTAQSMTALKNGSDEWITYSSAVTETVKVGFAGSGMITSFEGDQIKVTAEIIPVGGGTITIKEEDLEKFDVPSGYSRDQFIAEKANTAFGGGFATTDITVGEAYALGLVAEDENGKMAPVDGGNVKIKAEAAARVADAIKLGFNIEPRTDTGVTFSYQLKGMKANGDYESIGEAKSTLDEVTIPTGKVNEGYRYFKVEAVVTPAK